MLKRVCALLRMEELWNIKFVPICSGQQCGEGPAGIEIRRSGGVRQVLRFSCIFCYFPILYGAKIKMVTG